MQESVFEIINNSDTIIVSFAGIGKKFGTIQPFEFVNFLNKNYPNYSQLFLIDNKRHRYHLGIDGVSSNVDETVEFLKEKTKSYKKVYFLGNSAGGYAAILYGSLLNVTKVIAFIPQTHCDIEGDTRKFDERYADLRQIINHSTQYNLIADKSITNKNDPHHMSHCIRLKQFQNVHITLFMGLHLPTMRDSGELLQLFMTIFN